MYLSFLFLNSAIDFKHSDGEIPDALWLIGSNIGYGLNHTC